MHVALQWFVSVGLFFLGGVVTLSIIKLFIGVNEIGDDDIAKGLSIAAFCLWPLAIVISLTYILYLVVSSITYLNPLYLSDKLSDAFKPTFNVWKYKWTQRGLGVKNDWHTDGQG